MKKVFSKHMLMLVMAAGVAMASGCAQYQQAADGLAASALVSSRAAEDANIRIWKFDACGTPLSAVYRHPELIQALRALCMPNDNLNPAYLFEGVLSSTVKK